jgi:glycosyltransferase involved in cell wall biosynthesis
LTLKIAWAGPWNARSAIATFGAEVVAALIANGHHVEVLRTETGEDSRLPALVAPAAVHELATMEVQRIRDEYDVVVANMGDHFGYHGALAPFLLATDAVVIFHDAFMANFCSGWSHQFPDPDLALRAMVTAAYGPDAMPTGAAYWMAPADMMRRRPMIELFVSRATAAVVHAGHYRERVAGVCPGPVAMIPLAYRDLCVPAGRRPDEALVVATVGHVNSNKQIGEVIKAIGGSDLLRGCCCYRVIGSVEPEQQQQLEAEMRAHGVTEVDFTGWIDDETLRDLLTGVDVICCLRHPILEGGSASVIVAMLSGRAVLVSDHGVYGELPDDVVLKCQPGDEATDVRRHLEAFIEDRDAMWALGERARTYARQAHAPGRYANDLMALIDRTRLDGPALRTSIELGRVLASIGLGGDDPAVRAIARMMDAMLGRSPE